MRNGLSGVTYRSSRVNHNHNHHPSHYHANRLFVGNINFQITENELRSMLEPFGAVKNVRLTTDPGTGHPRGSAFVEMTSEDAIARAIEGLNGRLIGGRCLKVRLGF